MSRFGDERQEDYRSHGVETKEDRKRRREEKRQRHEEKRQRREARQQAALPPPKPPLPTERGSGAGTGTADDGSFVWKKKEEQLRRRGELVGPDDEARRRVELSAELEAAKRRRAQRDEERAAWEAEQAREARDREQEENAGWLREEASFHGAQHFLRQAIRLRQGRPVGTDALARNLRLDLLDVNPDEGNPVSRLSQMGLDAPALEALLEGVEKELDYVPDFPMDENNMVFNRGARIAWWESVKVCVQNALESSKPKYKDADGVHSAVQDDLDSMLQGKPLSKLLEMENEISKRLETNNDAVGVSDDATEDFAEAGFWTSALARIRVLIAELRLNDLNQHLVEERRKRVAAMPKEAMKDGHAGQSRTEDEALREDAMMEREVAKGMGPDEENFADEVKAPKGKSLPAAGYAWNDKFRPRKPRYYNRVHTGYDWTKYNRTHYDSDNPPPKTVQGYRFNVFYPDLIDPSKTPTFSISTTDNPEVCIITFRAGPPYEDLAFKIVNRPWEHSHRRGYRCSFDRGILHLWFNFQRYRYRR